MPAKNAGKYIDECLTSIRKQTFTFWELIIVNDHSTDDSLKIIEGFCHLDPRIKVFQNSGNGIIPALQLALSKTKGIYIARMDADDVMPEQNLALKFNALSISPPKTIITGLVKFIGTDEVSEGYSKYENWLNERVQKQDYWQWVYRECVIASPNWLVRKQEILDCGGFKDMSYPEDYDHVLKWHTCGFGIKGINETTLFWRVHSERISRNSDRYSQESLFRLKVGHFLKHELGNTNLILWGTSKKGRLTASILNKNKIKFLWMDLKPKLNTSINGQNILPFKTIENLSDFKLLISVYPEPDELILLQKYLKDLGLIMGENYWFL